MEQIRLAKKEDATYIAMLGRITFFEAFAHLFTDREGLKTYLNTTFSVDKIEKIERNRITINEKTIPISDSFGKEFYERLNL